MTEFVCGTGSWSGPKPGDPDNNSILSATGVFGGIEVSWTYPNTNAHAVAHTLLYRSIGDRFDTAIQVAIVSGNNFFDRNTIDPIRMYFYWIRFVTVNGTLLDPIGPAAGYALNDLDRVIEGMTGKIEAGLLATTLRSRIDKIEGLEAGVTNLAQTVSTETSILSQTLLGVQSDVDAALAYFGEEREARLLADGALATAINTTVAQAKEDLYAAVQEATDAQALVNGDLSAKYSVKVDLAGNVAGFGLASSGNVYDETIHSEFGVQADSFWVAGPSTVSSTAPLTGLYHGKVWVDTSNVDNPITKYYNKPLSVWQTTVIKGVVPFIVTTSPDPDTGAPAGVYIDAAYINKITANQIDARGLVIRDTPENGGGILFGAGNALDWSKIGGSGKPADGATSGSNLVKKSIFSDGSMGGWNGSSVCATCHDGVGELAVTVRDTFEIGNDFYVTPGETLFAAADIYTGASSYPASVGVMFTGAGGSAIHWAGVPALAAGQGWTRRQGSFVVPAGAIKAVPWLQIDGPGGQTLPYVAFSRIYVGRQQEGATVGAPVGTLVGGTLAQTVESNAATALSAANNANTALANKLDKASSAILSVASSGTTYVAGLRVGDLAWDSSGNRTSGKGIALTPKGILGHNGSKVTFSVDADTGDAFFGGSLEVGAVSASSLYAYQSGTTSLLNKTGFGFTLPLTTSYKWNGGKIVLAFRVMIATGRLSGVAWIKPYAAIYVNGNTAYSYYELGNLPAPPSSNAISFSYVTVDSQMLGFSSAGTNNSLSAYINVDFYSSSGAVVANTADVSAFVNAEVSILEVKV